MDVQKDVSASLVSTNVIRNVQMVPVSYGPEVIKDTKAAEGRCCNLYRRM